MNAAATLEAAKIPVDVIETANNIACVLASDYDGHVMAIARVILAEREKSEKLADSMYLTGVHDAYALAKNNGWQDFADRLVRETNERAKRSGLPKLEV